MVVEGGGFEVSNWFDMLGLAETFLQKDEEVSVAGYVWHVRNREVDSGGVGVLVNSSWESRMSSEWCTREVVGGVERGEGNC